MRTRLKTCKGFTLVELMVVLAVMAILATLAGAGISSYVRTARFNQNETNARTVFQTAQTALTRLAAGGELDAYLAAVKQDGVGVQDTYYTATDGVPEAAEVEEIHRYVYALFYNKNDTAGEAAQLVSRLLGGYIYDDTLLDASLCLELDVRSGQVFAVFYDSGADALAFGAATGATDISDRNFDHRADKSLVGCYSVDELVDVVQLETKQLKIQSLWITNGETLNIGWKSNAANEYGVQYVVGLLDKDKGEPLAEITVDIGNNKEQDGITPFNDASGQAILSVQKFKDGSPNGAARSYTFPLECKNGSYTLTLDAMMSAQALRDTVQTGNDPYAATFSILRLLGTTQVNNVTTVAVPDKIYATVQAKHHEGEEDYADSALCSTENAENGLVHPLFADGTQNLGGTAGYAGSLACYRHLYNLRWLAENAVGSFALQPEASQNNKLDWTGTGVVVYEEETIAGARLTLQRANPTRNAPVAFPTVETLPGGVTLQGGGNALANLQLRTASVAGDDSTPGKAHYAKYVGLFGHNYGTVRDLTLQDVDAVVNLAAADEAELNAAAERLQKGEYTAAVVPLTALRGVGALCGINTGVVENVSLTQSSAAFVSRVVAVVPFGAALTNAAAQGETTDGNTVSEGLATVTSLSVRGIGGIAGISRPAFAGELAPAAPGTHAKLYSFAGLTAAGVVGGLLLDAGQSSAATEYKSDADYYTAAKAKNGMAEAYQPLGIGGVGGMVVATADMGRAPAPGGTAQSLDITGNAAVYGNGYTGGVFGNLLARQAPAADGTPATVYTAVSTAGRVTATADYAPDKSAVLGRFFGGVAGYTAYMGLADISSGTAADKALSVAEVQRQYTTLMKGDFVGGIAGFADTSTLTGCLVGGSSTADAAEKTNCFVLGKGFVGGLVGGSAATIQDGKNNSIVLGEKYVGGIAGCNAGTIEYAVYDNTGGGIRTTLGNAGGIAGFNAEGAVISHSELKAGSITADNGIAGGIAADNAGTISDCTVSGGAINDTCSDAQGRFAIGAVAATNSGSIRSISVAGGVTLTSATATSAGGIVGSNNGTVEACTVSAMPTLALDAPSIHVGGAVGYNGREHSVTDTAVAADIVALDNYTNLGGVAGSNEGTLLGCTYAGSWSGSITAVNNTAGGIAGSNSGTLQNCAVTAISLKAAGISNVKSTMTAEDKLVNATHIGGVAGRNNAGGCIAGCTVAGSGGTGMVMARYGFVGGVAGSNAGSITHSGGASSYTAGGTTTTTLGMMQAVNAWTSTAEENGTPKTTEQRNNDLNTMIRVLTNSGHTNEAEQALATACAAIQGVDTVSAAGYGAVYSAEQNGNDLLVALRGGSTAADMADGCLGGITGFNSVTGSVRDCATGKWFVYSDNAAMDSTVGGAIGRNESNADNSGILNCAAVRRYTRGGFTPVAGKTAGTDDEDTNAGNERKTGWDNGNAANAAHVGGVIGCQQNRTGGDWAVTGLVNCGTVFNSRSNNVGGVIACWQGNGGTVQRCYNFGTMTTNMNDGDDSGSVGGLVACYDKPTAGIDTSILSCRNHGDAYYAQQGANDAAGIVGRVSIGAPGDTMTIRVSDCVNGNVQLKAQSMACGIFGFMGPPGTQLDGITVNVDRCRSFCTALDAGAGCNAGIIGNRSCPNPTDRAITNVTNCFALYNSNSAENNPIARSLGNNENLRGSGNYYMDANSFADACIGNSLIGMGRSITGIVRSDTVTATLNGHSAAEETLTGIRESWFNALKTDEYRIYAEGGALTVTVRAELAMPLTLQAISLYSTANGGQYIPDDAYQLILYDEKDNAIYTSAENQYCINEPAALAGTPAEGKKIKSFEVKLNRDGRAEIGLAEILFETTQNAFFDNENSGWDNAGESTEHARVQDCRLYAGVDNGAAAADAPNAYSYFAAAPAENTRVVRLGPYNSKIAAAGDAFDDPAVERTIVDADNNAKAALPLLYNDNDGDGVLSIHDVTDETIQNYYSNILDAAALTDPQRAAPAQPATPFAANAAPGAPE